MNKALKILLDNGYTITNNRLIHINEALKLSGKKEIELLEYSHGKNNNEIMKHYYKNCLKVGTITRKNTKYNIWAIW